MNLLDVIYPKKCVNCGEWGKYVCQKCEVGLWEVEQMHPPTLNGLVSLWSYEGVAQKIIKLAKYRGQWDTIEYLVSSYRFTNNPQFINFQKFLETKPIITPVPLHSKREFERGFNQAEVISKLVARPWMLDVRKLLVRTKDTGHQTNRNRQQRLDAMNGAFSLKSNIYNLPSNILLVDDVWTTGATMSECCRILKKSGVKTVWGLVLAR